MKDNKCKVFENDKIKMIRSSNYNFNFNKINGNMQRWGTTFEDDPGYSPFGAEILDLEISSSITSEEEQLLYKDRLVNDGGCKGRCPQCYKLNGSYPTYNMTFEEFKVIFHNVAGTKVIKDEKEYNWNDTEVDIDNVNDLKTYNSTPLTQIAFGIMNIDTNPDFFKMAEYCNKFGVRPNFTMHGLDNMDDNMLLYIKKTFGACAISVYNKDKSYNLLKRLTDIGMQQVNFHVCYYEQNYEFVKSVMQDVHTDERLKNLNALVLLGLKQKGGGESFDKLSDDKFDDLIEYAFSNNVPVGFDSCSCSKAIASFKRLKSGKELERLIELCEPCESFGGFSSYINCFGKYYPCSFMEKSHEDWMDGIDIFEIDDFVKDVWFSEIVNKWRNISLKCKRTCPVFKI